MSITIIPIRTLLSNGITDIVYAYQVTNSAQVVGQNIRFHITVYKSSVQAESNILATYSEVIINAGNQLEDVQFIRDLKLARNLTDLNIFNSPLLVTTHITGSQFQEMADNSPNILLIDSDPPISTTNNVHITVTAENGNVGVGNITKEDLIIVQDGLPAFGATETHIDTTFDVTLTAQNVLDFAQINQELPPPPDVCPLPSGNEVTIVLNNDIVLKQGILSGSVTLTKTANFPVSCDGQLLTYNFQLREANGDTLVLEQIKFTFLSFNTHEQFFVIDALNRTELQLQVAITGQSNLAYASDVTQSFSEISPENFDVTVTAENTIELGGTVTALDKDVVLAGVGIFNATAISLSTTSPVSTTANNLLLFAEANQVLPPPPCPVGEHRDEFGVCVPDIDDSVIVDMVTTSPFMEIKTGSDRITGSALFIANDSFNSFWYGKDILSFIQIKFPDGAQIVKDNLLNFTQTERD